MKLGRSELGLAIGALNLVIYTYSSCSLISDLFTFNRPEDVSFGLLLFTALLSVIVAATCVLLIMGIYKKRHNLMTPYLYIIFVLIVACIINIFNVGFTAAIKSILAAAFTALLWYPIYILYKEIREENLHGKPPQQC